MPMCKKSFVCQFFELFNDNLHCRKAVGLQMQGPHAAILIVT